LKLILLLQAISSAVFCIGGMLHSPSASSSNVLLKHFLSLLIVNRFSSMIVSDAETYWWVR